MNALDSACRYYANSQSEANNVYYLVHFPRRKISFIGQGLSRVIQYRRDGFHIQTVAEERNLPPVANPLDAINELLDPQRPAFIIISPDLYRSTNDPELPLIFIIQPQVEVRFSGYEAADDVCKPLPELSTLQWQTQSDELFLQRLSDAIATLKFYPEGKMILTRSYQRVAKAQNPFRLFEILSSAEPAAACSHFVQIGAEIVSLGCSPENVFELDGGRLAFDVVAATRGVSSDPDVDAQWLEALKNDPKEKREHLMALARYISRIEKLIDPSTLVKEKELEILQLGQVRHLYSRLSGIARSDLNWSNLLAESFPALHSYPDELQPLADNMKLPLRFYGGIVGHVSAGSCAASFYLNLRAILFREKTLYTEGGVGVIAESIPKKELREVSNKLSGLMRAVAAWEQES